MKMPLQGLIGLQKLKRKKPLGQLHFGVQVMNTVMAGAAHLYACIEGLFIEMLFKIGAAVQFFGNEVMKCKRGVTAATCTLTELCLP